MNFQRGAHESSTATEIAIALFVLALAAGFCITGCLAIKGSVVNRLYASRVERDQQ